MPTILDVCLVPKADIRRLIRSHRRRWRAAIAALRARIQDSCAAPLPSPYPIGFGRTLSPLMPDRGQQSDHRDARSRRKAGLKRA